MLAFDMDGVIVKYDRDGYIKQEDGLMPFEEPDGHYFYDREEDEDALELFRKCVKMMPDETTIITTVSKEPNIRYEQTIDKMGWIHERVPAFDVGSKFLALSNDKHNFIKDIRGMSLNKRDILIDDYNPNLFKWMLAGGTAIKYINGINNLDSWPGYSIGNDSAGNMFKELSDIIVAITRQGE